MTLSLKALRRTHVELEEKQEIIEAREREERIEKRQRALENQRIEKRNAAKLAARDTNRHQGLIDKSKIYSFLNSNENEIKIIELKVEKEKKKKTEDEAQKPKTDAVATGTYQGKTTGEPIVTMPKVDMKEVDVEEQKKLKKKKKTMKIDNVEKIDKTASVKDAEKRKKVNIIGGVDVSDIRENLAIRLQDLEERQKLLEAGGLKRHHLRVTEMEDYIRVPDDNEYDQLDDNLHRRTSIAYHPRQANDEASEAYVNPILQARIKSRIDEGECENHGYYLYPQHVPMRHRVGASAEVVHPLRGYPSTVKAFEVARVQQHCYDDDPEWVDINALKKATKARRAAKARQNGFTRDIKKALAKEFGKNQPISTDKAYLQLSHIELIDTHGFLDTNIVPYLRVEMHLLDWSHKPRAGDLELRKDGRIHCDLDLSVVISSKELLQNSLSIQLIKGGFSGDKYLGQGKAEAYSLLKLGYHHVLPITVTLEPVDESVSPLQVIIQCKLIPDKKRRKPAFNHPLFAEGSVSSSQKLPLVVTSAENSIMGSGSSGNENHGDGAGGVNFLKTIGPEESLITNSIADLTIEETTMIEKEDLRWRGKVDISRLNVEPAVYDPQNKISMFKVHAPVYDKRSEFYVDALTGKEKKFYKLKTKIFG